MNGDPVWLASLSRTDLRTGQLIPNTVWPRPIFDAMLDRLRSALDGAGDPTRERIFRMNATICIHRALSAAEIDRLAPSFWIDGASGLAGGPAAILSETVPGALSTKPCESPRRQPLPRSTHPDLWIPIECGRCAPCQARARL